MSSLAGRSNDGSRVGTGPSPQASAEKTSLTYFSPGHPFSPHESSPVKDRGEGAYRSESVSDSPSAIKGLTLAQTGGPAPASVPVPHANEPVKKEGPKKFSLA